MIREKQIGGPHFTSMVSIEGSTGTVSLNATINLFPKPSLIRSINDVGVTHGQTRTMKFLFDHIMKSQTSGGSGIG